MLLARDGTPQKNVPRVSYTRQILRLTVFKWKNNKQHSQRNIVITPNLPEIEIHYGLDSGSLENLTFLGTT